MSERRAAAKGRRLGSSRRRQVREGSGETPATTPGPGEEPPQADEIVQRVQDFLREQHKDQEGFVTRSDVQNFQEEGFPCSTEELELVFDGLDAAGTGRLSIQEFTAGLRQFLSSQKAAREHRRRKTAPRRVRLVLPIPALEGVDSEEQRHFAAFMDQLGTNNVSEEQEIWQLWVKLRQDEPQLLGNLEDFLAKMRHRIQEARSKKEALEVALNKRVAEHDKEVQQLCEVLEQQIQQEQQRLEQKSMARSQQHVVELQRVLDASEREVQRLVTAQMELERRCRSLRSTQQVTSTENRELEESNRVLEEHLQHLHQQLEQTQEHLRTMRATVAWEHVEEPGDRAVAELPGEMPMSPQSPGASEKFRSEMRIRLGSQSREGKARNSHQVVWEMLPEISISGAPQRASSAEEDPFPESLKEEHFSDQSSLLREMNDAIAALSKHLKAQAPDAPLALADTSSHPQDDAEPQAGPEAVTAHGTTPGILQEPHPGHISHELLEGDLKEGAATAELRAWDVPQAGGSVGDGHHTALEAGAEQGQRPEKAQGMSFLQGKGAGVKEMVLKVTEHLGESREAGEQAGMEVEGAGWMQEKTGWEKAQLLGEAEETGISQGESLEAGLGPPEAGQAVGQCLVIEELEPGTTPGECVQVLGMALQEWADPALGLSEKLEIELGGHLEPEPPSWGQVPMEAAHGDSVLPEVTVAASPGVLEEQRVSAQGEPSDAKVLPGPAGHGMSSRARGEEEEGEETQPREADVQLQGEPEREDTEQGGSTGAVVPLAVAVPPLTVAVPPPDAQKGAAGADVELLEAQNSDTNMQLLAEREADVQASGKAGSPGTGQGGRLDPDVQPLNKVSQVEVLEVEAKEAQADVLLHGDLNPGAPWGEEGGTAIQGEEEEEENGAQEQGECELPQEPVLDVQGAAVRQGEEAGGDRQPEEEAENLDTLTDQSTGVTVQSLAEVDELNLTPGGSTEADLQLLSEAGTEQAGNADPGVQPLDQVDDEELVEMEGENAKEETIPCGGVNPGGPLGVRGGTAIQAEEEEDGAQGQGECELPQEPVLDPQGAAAGQGEEAGAGVAERLDTAEDQSSDANAQLLTEVDELTWIPGGSTEADLQPSSMTDSLGTGQGESVDPGVQPLDQVNAAELVELLETEKSWVDKQLSGDASPEGPQQEGGHAAMQPEEEAEGWGQGQGEPGLPHEPGLHTLEHQSSRANVQLMAEVDELKLTPGGSTEAGLQLMGDAGSMGKEQRRSVDPDMQPLDHVDEQVLVAMEAEDAQTETQLGGGLSPGAKGGKATQLEEEEEEDGAQGQGECELPQEPVLDPQGAAAGQGEEAGAGVAERLDTAEDQSSDANAQLLTEVDELTWIPGGSTEADLQPSSMTDSLGTGQGESVDPGVQPLDQVNAAELVELLETEKSWVDKQLSGDASPEDPQQEGDHAAMQPEEEAEGWGQGQGEPGLPHEPGLPTLEHQSSRANVQLMAEVDELKSASGGSTEADLKPSSKSDSLGTGQGESVDPGVQPLDQEDKGELVEMETQDSRTDTELCGGVSTETLQEKGDCAAVQLRDEAEDEGQGQGGHGLLQDPVLDPQGARARQGAGAGAGVQPEEEAGHLDTLEGQSTGASTQLFTGEDGLSSASGGSKEAGLVPLGAAGRWEGKQSLTPGLGAGLCAAHTADTREGPAAAHVPPPAEASSYPEPVTAAEGPGVEAKLGAASGPDGHIPEDTQALKLPQGERAAAGGMPLGGAQGLEMVQGERLEEGVRSGVKTQGLGLHQGHDDGVSAPASPVSNVPVQTGTLKLERMMQEDVLIPDVWKSELQEQVSAQGHQVRIHTPAQQPEGKTPRVMEPEQVAAGPAEPPKQEVPPVSILPMRAQPQEDAGNDQLGMVLAESSLGDAANLCVQPQRQLLGEQSKDLTVGQGEKPQEFGVKMSQESKSSPGEAKAVTADGPEAAPKDCPKAPLDPDHLYNVLFVGDSHVGKTSFLYRLHADSFNPNLAATVGLDYGIKNLVVDNKRFALRLWDSAGQERYHSMTKQFFRKADGVVLMYDITSQYSFSDVRYWLSCIQEGAEEGIAILLLGNKTDCAAQRQVPTQEGECLAKEHQLMFYECSAASGHNVLESMESFVRLLKVREDELKNEAEEVPKTPQKKKSCCW